MVITSFKNDFKIDKNCRYSFSKAKEDIYGLMDTVQKQQSVIRRLVEELNVIKNNNSTVTVIQFNEAIEAYNVSILANDQRITEVWEYAETIKARVTRLSTSVKKIKKTQEKLVREVAKSSNLVIRKADSLSIKIASKQSQIDKLKDDYKELSKKATASKNAIAKFEKRVVKVKKSGGKPKMKDHNLVNVSEDHEMKYILKRYDKRQTKENVETLRKAVKKFKATHKNDDRPEVYRFIESSDLLEALA